MQHPFALKISDLEPQQSGQDLVEEVGDEEARSISGGLSIYTVEGKEEGGLWHPIPFDPPYPFPKPIPYPKPIDPPDVTTLALGEEGGDCTPIYIKKGPIATTLAIGEEGGDCEFYH